MILSLSERPPHLPPSAAGDSWLCVYTTGFAQANCSCRPRPTRTRTRNTPECRLELPASRQIPWKQSPLVYALRTWRETRNTRSPLRAGAVSCCCVCRQRRWRWWRWCDDGDNEYEDDGTYDDDGDDNDDDDYDGDDDDNDDVHNDDDDDDNDDDDYDGDDDHNDDDDYDGDDDDNDDDDYDGDDDDNDDVHNGEGDDEEVHGDHDDVWSRAWRKFTWLARDEARHLSGFDPQTVVLLSWSLLTLSLPLTRSKSVFSRRVLIELRGIPVLIKLRSI